MNEEDIEDPDRRDEDMDDDIKPSLREDDDVNPNQVKDDVNPNQGEDDVNPNQWEDDVNPNQGEDKDDMDNGMKPSQEEDYDHGEEEETGIIIENPTKVRTMAWTLTKRRTMTMERKRRHG